MVRDVAGFVEAMKGHGLGPVCIIPCMAVQQLIATVESEFQALRLTREEEAVGVCAGAHLAGMRPAIIMQNSGLGNSVNALKSLVELYGIPLVLIVSHRGGEGEQIAGQVPMGQATQGLLDSLGIERFSARELGAVEALDRAVEASEKGKRAAAVLVEPGVLA